MIMADKKKMPVTGGGAGKGKPDGASGSPATGEEGRAHGRSAGGESGGGAYPNPHSGKEPDNEGFLSHGGQTEMSYHGGNNPNATAGPQEPAGEQAGSQAAAAPERKPHTIQAGQRTIDVVEESGIAAAEASGKVATDAPYEREQKSPGAG